MKPYEKKEKDCCNVVFARSAKTTLQQIIPLIIQIAEPQGCESFFFCGITVMATG